MSDDHRIGSVLLKFDWSAATLILFFYNSYLSSFNLVLCNRIRRYLLLMDRAQSSLNMFMQFAARACYIIDKYLRIHLTRGTYLVVCMSAA